MKTTAEITSILEKHKLSNTACRRSVLNLFFLFPYALSHNDIEEELKTEFDRVTIYRTFNSFEQKGLIHKVIDNEGNTKYAICSSACTTGHHNDSHIHFSCSKCLRTICIDQCKVPEINIPDGYLLKKINLLVEGICKSCQK